MVEAAHRLCTRLAQLVERWPFKPVVVGSSPTGGDAALYACTALFAEKTLLSVTSKTISSWQKRAKQEDLSGIDLDRLATKSTHKPWTPRPPQ